MGFPRWSQPKPWGQAVFPRSNCGCLLRCEWEQLTERGQTSYSSMLSSKLDLPEPFGPIITFRGSRSKLRPSGPNDKRFLTVIFRRDVFPLRAFIARHLVSEFLFFSIDYTPVRRLPPDDSQAWIGWPYSVRNLWLQPTSCRAMVSVNSGTESRCGSPVL